MFVRVRQDKIAWKDRRIRFLELENRDDDKRIYPARFEALFGIGEWHGSAWTLLHCFTSGRKSRDEKGRWRRRRRRSWRNRDGFSSHGYASRPFLFSPPFLDRTRPRYAKVKDLPIREPVPITRENLCARRRTFESAARWHAPIPCSILSPATRTGRAAPTALPFPTTIFRVRLDFVTRVSLSRHIRGRRFRSVYLRIEFESCATIGTGCFRRNFYSHFVTDELNADESRTIKYKELFDRSRV